MNSSLNVFDVNYFFISKVLKGLWGSPEIISQIIKNSEPEIVKTNLAPFIVHNFFSNVLSENYMENNLLYIIAILLKDEIDKLENVNQVDNFLENTKCGYLLEEFIKMPDIQIFFNKVIIKTVEKIEKTYSFLEINFKVSEILKEFNNIKQDVTKNFGKNNKISLDERYKKRINRNLIDISLNYSKEENNRKIHERNRFFIEKYSPDLTSKEIEEYNQKAQDENKNTLAEFFNKLKEDIKFNKNNDELFSNTTLMKNMLETNFSPYILSFYENHFFHVTSFIEQLLEDLINNILLLPNSIKFICKIISILIKNKFKNISKVEENSFISKFIIEKLLIPIISFPSFNAIISDYVISGNTIKNIKVINFFLKKLFSCKLFLNNEMEGDYTPFNWFFIDKMENILYFYEKSINVNIPKFIEEFCNDILNKHYSYDYFNENKEQICVNISICFNYQNLYNLVKGLTKLDDIFWNDDKVKNWKKHFTRLKNAMKEIKAVDENLINKIKKSMKIADNKNNDKKQQIEVENYYLYNTQEYEKKYNYLFLINNKIANFYIDINKAQNLDEDRRNIIKTKNYLCNSLGNYRLINKLDFNLGTTSSTLKMLNEIKNYMTLPTFTLNNNTVPSIWYINSLLDYLNKIPEEYKENDFRKLFIELGQNLRLSINNLDFEKLIIFRNKLKFIDKINNYYDNVKNSFNNILINEKVKKIVEKLYIPIQMSFTYDKKEKKFELERSNIKEKVFEDRIIYVIKKKNSKIKVFRTIEAFTRYFPNLAKYQCVSGANPIQIIKDLSINHKINEYFKIIGEKIIKSETIDKENYVSLYHEKIKNYIMNKIYERIYPPEPNERDKELYQKATKLSWVEPLAIIGKDYIFDSMLPDILNEFEQINIVSTPYKKFNCIKIILNYIESLIKLNKGEDKEIEPDELFATLNYAFIKAHPFRMSTDIEFIKVFLKDKEKNDISLTNFDSMCEFIIKCNAKFFKMSEEEYNKKCSEVVVNNNYKDKK